MKTSAVTVDKRVHCVTIIVLPQLIAPQLCKESTAPNDNYGEVNAILHQKSKFFNTIICCLVNTRCSKQSKEFRVTQIGEHANFQKKNKTHQLFINV